MEYNTPMNGAEIARELGISRQAVSYSLRKSMNKMYHYVMSNDMANTPFDAILVLMSVLGVSNSCVSDIEKFLKLFDKSIVNQVKADASSRYNISVV